MSDTVAVLNFIIALGGIGLLCGSAVLLLDFFTSRSLKAHIQRYGIWIAFFLTACGVVMTLIYSEYLGFVPCSLCWFQRIFLYPQAFLAGTALFVKDKYVAAYGVTLSCTGIVFALYQHYLQMGGSDAVGCPLGGGDCTERILFEFGFMTFPLVSACLFIFLIILYTYLLKTRT